MAITPTPITPLPTPVPQRSDPANFAARGDALMTALPVLVTETNAAGVVTYNNAVEAALSATNALTSASNASIQANAAAQSAATAAATAGAAQWVSGTTYTVGNVVWSPVNFLSYRRKIAGGGTTDPSLDLTNWALIGAPSSLPTSVINSNTTAQASVHYIFSSVLELTLPVSPSIGSSVQWSDISGVTGSLIKPGVEKIRGISGDMLLNSKNTSRILVYSGTTLGWV